MNIIEVDDIYVYHKASDSYKRLWLNRYMYTVTGATVTYILTPNMFNIAKDGNWYTFGKHDFAVNMKNSFYDEDTSISIVQLGYESNLLTEADLERIIPDELSNQVLSNGESFWNWNITNHGSSFVEGWNATKFYINFPNVNISIAGNSIYNYIVNPDYRPCDIFLNTSSNTTPFYTITLQLASSSGFTQTLLDVVAIFGTYESIYSNFDVHVEDYEFQFVSDINNISTDRLTVQGDRSIVELSSSSPKTLGMYSQKIAITTNYTTAPSIPEYLEVKFKNKNNNNYLSRRFVVTYVK